MKHHGLWSVSARMHGPSPQIRHWHRMKFKDALSLLAIASRWWEKVSMKHSSGARWSGL